jgi:DNA-binding NarL/FixJ family response regulator
MTNGVRVVIADDHPIVRKGLRQAIVEDPQLKVVAEAEDGEAALAQIQQLNPDVVILDIDMPKLDGLGVAREVQKKSSTVEIIFLTIHGEEDLFHAAMDLGAKGYILKESAITEIVSGIRAVAAGEYYVTPLLSSHLLQRRARAGSSRPGLNDRFHAGTAVRDVEYPSTGRSGLDENQNRVREGTLGTTGQRNADRQDDGA